MMPEDTPRECVIKVGDFNSYAKQDPIDLVTSAGIFGRGSRFDPADFALQFLLRRGLLFTPLSRSARP